jgi:hypothetical protein
MPAIPTRHIHTCFLYRHTYPGCAVDYQPSGSFLFGLGHLPATQATGLALNELAIGRAIVLSGLVGIATGWLYQSRGLGSAMLAHFSEDILLHGILPVLLWGRSSPGLAYAGASRP